MKVQFDSAKMKNLWQRGIAAPARTYGETQADQVGELFGAPELAVQYGARVAQDIASDPDYDPGAGTVVIVADGAGAEIARRELRGGRKPWR
ncbi:hypothetical protein ACVIWV_006421 [Bradyrhizobium diazoefficiens]|jgi:hypothetical protein|uniref:hypothetical protein n=1 Tax=Bradyrhizobium TaxID=374 RepID=UPI000AF716CF|nr:hypothetical protein [Bradyrhizobium diazoefficiens]